MLWEPAFAHLITTKTVPAAGGGAPAIASPVFGVDTSLTATFFQDADGATPAAGGQTVGRIHDAFAVNTPAFVFQQTTANLRPQLVPNAAAGKNGLRFTGTQTLRLQPTSGSGTLFQGRSFTMACALRFTPSGSDERCPFFAGHTSGGQNGGWYDNVAIVGRGDGGLMVQRMTGSDYAECFLNSATFVSGQLVKLVARCSQANGIEVRTRATAGAFSGTTGLPASADVFPWDNATLGSGPGFLSISYPAYLWNGDVYEFRFWGSRASDTEFTQLQSYLDSKWGS